MINHMTGPAEMVGGDAWDEELARDLVGSTLLVGLTYVDRNEQVVRRRQIFGRVTSVDPQSGIQIREDLSGEMLTVAPLLEAVEPGEHDFYQLSDEDMMIENPDFVALLTVRSPVRS